MCELLAYQNGKPVFINPVSKPEINLVSNDASPLHNLYYLDTIQKKWLPQSKSVLTDLSRPITSDMILGDPSANGDSSGINFDFVDDKPEATTSVGTWDSKEVYPPLMPSRPNHNNPVIKISIDPASFKELMVYDNLQFELDDREKNFNAQDTAGEWSDFQLTKAGQTGLYFIKFIRPGRTISYQAKPVLEGEDYNKAIAIFNEKKKEYDAAIKEREKQDEISNVEYRKDSLESIRIDKENEQMLTRNKLIKANNQRVDQEGMQIQIENEQRRLLKLMQARNNRLQLERLQIQMQIEQARVANDKEQARKLQNSLAVSQAAISQRSFRPFLINQFGVWNCDHPELQNLLEITATFTDEKNTKIDVTNIAVFCRQYNSVYRFTNNKMGIIANADNMIIGTFNGRFTYITYEEYAAQHQSSTDKNKLFKMTVTPEGKTNYSDILEMAYK
jgi:hypothetical protein